MHYGQPNHTYAAETNNALGKPQLVQPADPMTDRIQKALGDLGTLIDGAENDLNAVSRRLFGERVAQTGGEGPLPTPNGADEAIGQGIAFLTTAAHRVRALAAELNGRI